MKGAVAEVSKLMLKLGVLGFGGPAAHIAMMRDETVRRRGWLSDEEFMEMVGATNLIPGPNSTEMAMHIGLRRAGARGLVAAGASFIVPAVVIVGAIAWLYAEYGTDPLVFDIRYGVLPVIIAIIAHAVWGLGRSNLRNPVALVTAAAALGAYLLGLHELVIIASLGVVWGLVHLVRNSSSRTNAFVPFTMIGFLAAQPSLARLFLVFLEVGSVLYGSGYVLVAFLDSRLVTDTGYLTAEQLLDAVAVGQITPGPVFTTATFIGWQILGVSGAALATLGIFGPSFVFVGLLDRFLKWLRARPAARAFLSGVTFSSLGLMAGVLVRLGDAALVDPFTWIVAAAALVLLITTRVGAGLLVPAGVIIGLVHAAVA
ncbi:MAG: chromate efflux transporter [Ilumatobacteraceae bacterium]